jgi:hypothetical protein
MSSSDTLGFAAALHPPIEAHNRAAYQAYALQPHETPRPLLPHQQQLHEQQQHTQEYHSSQHARQEALALQHGRQQALTPQAQQALAVTGATRELQERSVLAAPQESYLRALHHRAAATATGSGRVEVHAAEESPDDFRVLIHAGCGGLGIIITRTMSEFEMLYEFLIGEYAYTSAQVL